jgi:hypothetical protein
VLTGIILDDMMFERRAFTVRQAKQVLAIHILALCLLAGGGVVYGACRLREFLPAILITAGVIVVGAFVVGVLFAKDRAGLAAGTMFTWFVAVIMVVFVWFVNPLDHNEPSGRFGNAVAGVVPSMDKLAAYRSVSPRFVHYFGRPVLEIEDTGELERLYQRAYWIVAFGGDLDELLKAGRFELVYRERCIEMRKQNAVAGGLFHRQ